MKVINPPLSPVKIIYHLISFQGVGKLKKLRNLTTDTTFSTPM